jgi:hypothetical protein
VTKVALAWSCIFAIVAESFTWMIYLFFGEAGGDYVNWAATMFAATHAVPFKLEEVCRPSLPILYCATFGLGAFQWFVTIILCLLIGTLCWKKLVKPLIKCLSA